MWLVKYFQLATARACSTEGGAGGAEGETGTGPAIDRVLSMSGSRMRGARAASAAYGLDREAVEVGHRVLGVEHLAVEEGLQPARGRGRDVARRHTQFLRGLAPQVLAVHLAHPGLHVEVLGQIAPADVLGEEPQVVALEGVRGLVLPVAHLLRAVLDHA